MVEVITQYPGWSAEEIERQITIPIETALLAMPGLTDIRSLSIFGLSDIKFYFGFGTDYFMDRQEGLEPAGDPKVSRRTSNRPCHPGGPSPKSTGTNWSATTHHSRI